MLRSVGSIAAARADTMDGPPRVGDRILLFTPDRLELVLANVQTMTARKVRYKPGRYLLGCDGRVRAVALLHRAMVVESQRTWERLRPTHRSCSRAPPYKPKTFLFKIVLLSRVDVPYSHPKGAINIAIFRGPRA